MSMAWGLEARVPFLDHVLVEHLTRLPSRMKLKGFTPKFILRQAMAKLLPAEIVNREKHGFEVPVDDWIRGELRGLVRDYVNEQRIRSEGFFEWPTVERLLVDHWEGQRNLGPVSYTHLTLPTILRV